MPSKKRCDQLALAGARVAEAPDPEALARAQHAGDRDDAVLLVRQELAAGLLAALRLHGLADLLVAQAVEADTGAARTPRPARSRCRTPA